jgi:hypothetical protein
MNTREMLLLVVRTCVRLYVFTYKRRVSVFGNSTVGEGLHRTNPRCVTAFVS